MGGAPPNLNFFIRVRTRSSVLPKQTGDDSERSYLARSLIQFDAGLQYLFLFLEHTKKPLPLLKLLFSQKVKGRNVELFCGWKSLPFGRLSSYSRELDRCTTSLHPDSKRLHQHDTCLIRHVHVAQYVAFAHNSAEHR